MKTIIELSQLKARGYIAFLPMSIESARKYDMLDERKVYLDYKNGAGALVILTDEGELIINRKTEDVKN